MNADKKLSTRKAPAEKANTYEEGYAMDGVDGMLYVVKANKNGIKRWAIVTKSDTPSESEKVEEPSESEKVEEPSESEKDDKKAEKAKKKTTTRKAPAKKAEEEKPEPNAEAETDKAKKTTRKAPAKKASTFNEGYETDGSDGNPYVVKADKNGTKKWMKQKVVKEEKPKRAPTAYTNFIKVTLPELRKMHSDKKTSECMKIAGGMWNDLPKDEKNAFLA